MSVQVRESTLPDDFQFISDLVVRARDAGERWAASWTQTLILGEFQATRVFVADVAGQRAGFILLRPPGPAWEITLTAVATTFRKSGVFSSLISEVLAVVGRGALSTEIFLEVRADNSAAKSAYESCGFSAVGRRRAYYSDGTDAILYKRP
jgi:[ribosomal protein S18]-alanine N-acetyltransferase